MEKTIGLYSRQGIMMRKPNRVVDKNHTFSDTEFKKALDVESKRLNHLDDIHNFRRVTHFGSKVEKTLLKTELKRDAEI